MTAPAKSSGLTRDQARRVDGMIENALSGLGIPGVDVAESTVLTMRAMSTGEARAQLRFSWAAAVQVEQPAGDIIREGFELEDLPEGVDASKIKAYMAQVGDQHMPEDRGVLQALSWLYAVSKGLGGGVAVMIIADGLPPWEPVDFDRIEDLVSIEVLERDEVTPYRTTLGGPIEFYIIGTSRTTIEPASIVHHSRVIVGRGRRLMPSEEWRNLGWGASVLEVSAGPRTAMHSACQEMGSLVLKTTQDVVYIAELADMMCREEKGGTTGTVTIDERIALMAKNRGQHRIIPLDGGRDASDREPGRPSDKMETLARNVRGVADLQVAIADQWAASIQRPPSIALGKTLGGLNTGTNAGDWQTWGGFISCEQQTWLKPRLDRVIEVVTAAKNGPTGGKKLTEWKTTFPPIWQPTAAEEASTALIWAQTDAIYQPIAGATSPEIREQRLVQGATGQLHLDPLPVPPTDPETGAPLDPETGEPLPADPALEEPEPTEDEIAWSDAEPPADAETARELVDSGELGSTSTQQIHSMARRGEITAYRGRSASKVPLYSMVEVKNAILARNADPEPEPEDELETDDKKDASLWRRFVAMVRG